MGLDEVESASGVGWFAGEDVGTVHAVLPGGVLFLRAPETVEAGFYAHLVKPQLV